MDVLPGTALYPQPRLQSSRTRIHTPPGDANKNNSPKSSGDAQKNRKQSSRCGAAMSSFLAYLQEKMKTKSTPKAGSTSVGFRVAQSKAQQAERTEQSRIFSVGRDLHQVSSPTAWPLRAGQKSKHVVKDIVQMSPKHWQAWGIDHLSRKPVPVSDHSLGKEMFPHVQSEPPFVQLWTIPMGLITGSQGEELSTFLSTSLPHEAGESNKVFPGLLFSTLEQCQLR